MINKELVEKYRALYFIETNRNLAEDLRILQREKHKNDPNYWLEIVSNYFRVPKERICSSIRGLSIPKGWFYYLCRIHNIDDREIGRCVSKDRSTVSKVSRSFFNKNAGNPDFRKIKEDIMNSQYLIS